MKQCKVIFVWAAVLLAAAMGWRVARTPEAVSQAQVTAVPSQSYDYSAPAQAISGTGVREGLRRSVTQWSDSPRDSMRQMTERLARVSEELNAVAGTQCIVMLGHGSRAEQRSKGIVTVDPALVLRLQEGALAALLAHEMAHEVLNHERELQRIRADRDAGRLGTEERIRILERQADHLAGQLIAKAGFEADGVHEMLRVADLGLPGTEPNSHYYPAEQRLAAFLQGYGRIRNPVMSRPASQPGD